MLPDIDSLATVVVCEDDVITRDLLIENLEADRYRALAAPTASDALRFCRFSQPDALLLDLALPDAAGLDVLRRIRSSEGPAAEFDSALPVLIVTGRSAADDRVRGLSEGADDYLSGTGPMSWLRGPPTRRGTSRQRSRASSRCVAMKSPRHSQSATRTSTRRTAGS